MRRVLIIQKALPNYRLDFFNGLNESLKRKGIELVFIYGNRDKKASLKKDETELDWAIKIKNHYINIGPFTFIWQPCLKYLKNQDLIITEQANKLLLNYYLMVVKTFSGFKLAFWGHGRNRQAKENNIGNILKKWFINMPDWWFAYTRGVKNFLKEKKYPSDKITIVQNAVNTLQLNEELNSITANEVKEIVDRYSLNGSRVAIYCGGIYSEKRIDFLIEACDQIKQKVPGFKLIVIGAGEESYKVDEAAKNRNWIHYLGPIFGREKAKLFKVAEAFLMPGLVGLAVLDSFALLTPMITTCYPFHSPEIEYLKNHENGIISENNLSSYVDSCVGYFNDNELQKRLKSGCEESYHFYTVEKMIENFSNGISDSLGIANIESVYKVV